MNTLHNFKKSQDPLIKAEACLLLGIIEQDSDLCKAARKTYKISKHIVGELEAFNAIAKLTLTEDVRSVLNVCQLAHYTADLLREQGLDETASTTFILQQAAEFYCLYKKGDFYYTPPKQPSWICGCSEMGKDYDGMIAFRISEARMALARYFSKFVTKWLQEFEVQHKLESGIKSFKLHNEILRNKFVGLSRVFSALEMLPTALKEYIHRHIQLLELRQLKRVNYTDIIIHLLSVFSPHVSVYLPLSKMHVSPMRGSQIASTCIHEWIASTIHDKEKESLSLKMSIDPWLNMWRACCLTNGNMMTLNNSVLDLAKTINTEASTFQHQKPVQSWPLEKYNAPPAFLLWRNENKYYHIFLFWLRSCQLIKEGSALDSSKCVIYHLLSTIADSNGGVYISVMNLVDMLSIHCTSLLAMISYSDVGKKDFIVPLLYKHAVQIFDDLNCHVKGEKWMLTASMVEVERRRNSSRSLAQLRSACLKLLWRALDIILGIYSSSFSLLSYSMKQERTINSSATRQLLILALVLFGNLVLTQKPPPRPRDFASYQNMFLSILEKSQHQPVAIPSIPEYIRVAYQYCASPHFISLVFSPLLEYLLLQGEPNAGAKLARLMFPKYHKINFVAIPCHIQHRPIPAMSHLQQSVLQFSHPGGILTLHASAGAGAFTPTSLPPRPLQHATLRSPQQSPHFEASLAGVSPHTIIPDAMSSTFPTPGSVPSHPSSVTQPAVTTMFQSDASPRVMPPPHAQSQYHPQTPTQQIEIKRLPSPLKPSESVKSVQPHYQNQPQVRSSLEDQPSVNFTTNAVLAQLIKVVENVATDKQLVNNADTQTGVSFLEQEKSVRMESYQSDSRAHEAEYDRSDSYSEYEELEFDEDISRIVGSLPEPASMQKTGELVDNSLADENFCVACRLPLRADIKGQEQTPIEETEDVEEKSNVSTTDAEDVDESIETYQCHMNSKSHQENVIIYQKFKSDLLWHYSPLMEELAKVLEDLEGNVGRDPSVAKFVDDAKDEKEAMENEVEELSNRSSWRDGIREINEMADRIQSLLNRAAVEQKHKSVTELVEPDSKTGKFEAVDDSDEEQEEDVKPTPEEPVEVPQGKKLRTREQKMQSRQKKRARGRGRK